MSLKFDQFTDDEKIALTEKGFDPEDINSEGTDIERKVTNIDTVRKQWLIRAKKLEHFSKNLNNPDSQRIISELRKFISDIPLDSYTDKRNLKEVNDTWDDDYWPFYNALIGIGLFLI